jgi:hypothetical protein
MTIRSISVRVVFCVVFPAIATALLAAAPAKPTSLKTKRIERGRYLVTIAGCDDCHSPKIDAQMTPDPNRMLSGRPSATTAPPSQGEGEIRASLDLTAWSGPWGISYAANLTPDPETGIGKRYTEAAFIKTIRTGKKPEGEPLLPPMPWAGYRNMTDEDLKSVYAFMKTLKPVHNAVRSALVMPPAK